MSPSETPAECADSVEPVVLIIADISGYTRYMTANAKTLAHSQTIITELVKAIVRQVDLPLEVAKLEGDAIFLFGRKSADPDILVERKKLIGRKLFTFFECFRQKLNELSYSTTCNCNACAQIEKLRLKVIAHSGEALFHRVLNFQELAGVDVIIVHRLLKNSVQADQYLLLTEAAQRDIELPNDFGLVRSSETYEGIGTVKTGIYYPESEAHLDSHAIEPPGSFSHRFSTAWALLLKLWFQPLKRGGCGHDAFHHLEACGRRSGRWTFAALTLILTPFYLPVGMVRVFFRALRKRS